jgi:hypothetical protein
MAKKNKIKAPTKLSEPEKEKQRLIIPFDEAKMFVSNMGAILENDPLFSKWEINRKFTTLKGSSLKLEYVLKQTAIEKRLEEMDPAQQLIGAFVDPDEEDE